VRFCKAIADDTFDFDTFMQQKTHTIMGPNPTTSVSYEDIDAGVIPRAMTAIFNDLKQKKELQDRSRADLDFQVRYVRMIELLLTFVFLSNVVSLDVVCLLL
jgi:hypothetical protein